MVAMNVRAMPISRPQQEFRQLKCWLRGYCAGRGAGKTRIGAVCIYREAKPGDSWMIISPDNNMIRETTLPTFIEVGEFTGQLIKTVTSPTPRAFFTSIHGKGKPVEVVFKGAEVPDKLRGPNRSGIWYDEASIIHEDAFSYGIATCRKHGVMGPCLCTFTPRGFNHWTFKKFYERIDEIIAASYGSRVKWFQGRAYVPTKNSALVHCRTRDNPFLPKEFESTIAGNYSSMLNMQELGGEFVEITGLIFKREWFKLVDQVPIDCQRVRFWDKAASADKGCFTVGLLMAKDSRGIYYVEDVVRGQWNYHERNQIMLQTARRDSLKYGGSVMTYIEQEGGGDGKTIMDQLLVMLAAYPVRRQLSNGGQQWKVSGNVRLPGDSKVRRALPLQGQAEAGNIRVLDAKWTSDWIEEIVSFPDYAFADQVDATAYAFNRLAMNVPDNLFTERDVVESDMSHYGHTVNHAPTNSPIPRYEDLPWAQDFNPAFSND